MCLKIYRVRSNRSRFRPGLYPKMHSTIEQHREPAHKARRMSKRSQSDRILQIFTRESNNGERNNSKNRNFDFFSKSIISIIYQSDL